MWSRGGIGIHGELLYWPGNEVQFQPVSTMHATAVFPVTRSPHTNLVCDDLSPQVTSINLESRIRCGRSVMRYHCRSKLFRTILHLPSNLLAVGRDSGTTSHPIPRTDPASPDVLIRNVRKQSSFGTPFPIRTPATARSWRTWVDCSCLQFV